MNTETYADPIHPVPTLTETQRPGSRETAPSRLLSVDAFRGFDMFWIMGGDYIIRSLPKIHDSPLTRALAAQMDHCEWAGFHFYDLIFPMFLFIVGASLVFSISRMVERAGRAATIKRIFIRSIVLFLLGMFYMGGVADGFENVYFAGVLHRIAVAYFFTALIFCFLGCSGRRSQTVPKPNPTSTVPEQPAAYEGELVARGVPQNGLIAMIVLCF